MNTPKPPSKHLPIDRILAPFRTFIRRDASPGILLIICTVIALAWANSPWAHSYETFWHTPLGISIGEHNLSFSLQHWINDGLMAMFFFVVGLEIKREVLAGELASFRQAFLPIVAAIGGMIVPALLYLCFNFGTSSEDGWGIPMATDIAFAIGVLTLFGNRVPISLKIFLTALAIVDDIGAVLVIAFFYTSDLNFFELFLGLLFLLTLAGANYLGVRNALIYGVLGIGGLWLSFLLSGIHPSIAGVLGALTIPARTRLKSTDLSKSLKPLIEKMERHFPPEVSPYRSNPEDLLTKGQLRALSRMEKLCEYAGTPLQRIEKGLHNWVIFLIMPLFALANAGVELEGNVESMLYSPVSFGIIAGLVLGKQIGIMSFSYLAIRLGFARLPLGVTYGSLYGVSCLAGIGFTMSLFISGLAFSTGSPYVSASKLAILLASVISGLLGWLMIALYCPKRDSASTTA